MINKEIITRRLALIKYLFKLGVEQSKQIEPLSAFSILNFHDSVEMFLKLLTEKLNIKSDTFNFLDYWDKIPDLTLKESMRNLNTRRVNIKHKWIFPSKADIDISKINTADFFQQNTESQFGITFDNINLLELISYEKVKQHLLAAQNFLLKWDSENCVWESAIGFHVLMSTYEGNKTNYYSRNSPLSLVKDCRFRGDIKFEELDKINESLTELENALKIIGFGIDYKRYTKFKILTPHVWETMWGPSIWWTDRKNKKWSKENCEYCIDFVIESCLKLQEFDFEITELEY